MEFFPHLNKVPGALLLSHSCSLCSGSSQSRVPWPAVSASPGCVFEVQVVRPHPTLTGPEGGRPGNVCLRSPLVMWGTSQRELLIYHDLISVRSKFTPSVSFCSALHANTCALSGAGHRRAPPNPIPKDCYNLSSTCVVVQQGLGGVPLTFPLQMGSSRSECLCLR